MILDTSAIVAAIAGERDGGRFQGAMLGAVSLAISTITVLETRIVLHSRHGFEVVRAFDEMLENARISVVPFDHEMAAVAFDAFRKYGKGQGHPAQLNIVDCAAYALAKVWGEPLLFKGNDFSMTDIVAAIRRRRSIAGQLDGVHIRLGHRIEERDVTGGGFLSHPSACAE